MSRQIARTPVATLRLDMSSTNITTSAWATLVASQGAPVSAIEIFNGSASPMLIARGAAASEVAIPYTILPGGSSILLPIEIARGVRLSAKALGTSVTAGEFILNFFA